MQPSHLFINALAGTLVFSVFGCGQKEKPHERRRPNILFCMADDASYPHMSAYGCDWVNTPGFDRVADNGILFNNAYVPNAKSAPCRSTLLTGRYSWQLEEAANHVPHFPEKFKTYAEVLSEHGYFVGHTGKGWAPGDPGEINGEPRHLAGTPYQSKTTEPPASNISNTDYAGNFRDFLEKRSGDQPFCFWYGGYEPHRAYEFGAGVNKAGKQLSDIDEVYDFWPDNDTVRKDMLDYAFEIEYFDKHLRQMLTLLEMRGELENTLVVVTADNGMPFPRIKGQCYEPSNHMPLAIMWADGIANPGREIDDFVSFVDIAPTFLELAGVNPKETEMEPIEGKSLTDIFYSKKSGMVNTSRDYTLIGKERHDIGRPNDNGYPVRGIVTDEYLYLRNFEPSRWPAGLPVTGYLNCDGSPTKTTVLDRRGETDPHNYWKLCFGKRPGEELYNIEKDPGCMNNLAGDTEYEEIKARLKEQLFSDLKAHGDPRMFDNGEIFDDYEYAGESTRNYYERYMNGEDVPAGWVNESDYRVSREEWREMQ